MFFQLTVDFVLNIYVVFNKNISFIGTDLKCKIYVEQTAS